MKQRLLVLLAALALAPAMGAQTKPDFSGTWMMDPSRSQSAVQNEPVKSMTLVIKQSATDLSIDVTRDGRQHTVTYKPGGPDTLGSSTGRSGSLASIWYWDGQKLVTETLSDVNAMTMRTKAIYTLEAGGSELAVDSLMIVEHGYTLRGAQNYGSGKDVFKKIAP
jgi:hypothetical protein